MHCTRPRIDKYTRRHATFARQKQQPSCAAHVDMAMQGRSVYSTEAKTIWMSQYDAGHCMTMCHTYTCKCTLLTIDLELLAGKVAP